MKRTINLAFLGLLVFCVSSCFVSKKKYNALGQDYEDMEMKLIKTQKEKIALENEIKLVNAEMDFIRDKAAAGEEEFVSKNTTVKFAKYLKDFGDIKQESENVYTFYFTNTGDKPLFITSAKGSCGCTVPTYPKEPVQPGEKSSIKVVYKPGMQEGEQEKTVTITGNLDKGREVIRIKANVLTE